MELPFGKNLRQCRLAAGLTQQRLAHELRVSIGTVVHLEGNTKPARKPDLDVAVRVAEFFNQSLDWLVLGRGEPRPVPRHEEAAQ